MADPLRRTLLAKLRGKKPRKGASSAAGSGSAAADGGLEGNKVPGQVVLVSGLLDLTAARTSTYENCAVVGEDGTGGEVGVVPMSRAATGGEAAGSTGSPPPEPGSGAWEEDEEQLHRQIGGRDIDISLQGPGAAIRGSGALVPGPGVTYQGPHVRTRLWVSVPKRRIVGDSIGFGDESQRVFHRNPVQVGVVRPPTGTVSGGGSRCSHMAGTVVSVHEDNWNPDSRPSLDTNPEEQVLIRNLESYGPDGKSALQSPTFFPTQLEICNINLGPSQEALRYPPDSEDEDYYDNQILPFYQTLRPNRDSGGMERPEPVLQDPDRGQAEDGGVATETDRLRTQLKEAYYLLINAMKDINLEAPLPSRAPGGSSSCSSPSRDSLSSKHLDSDSWSSGGELGPQHGSDSDPPLLFGGLRWRVERKSLTDLTRPTTRTRLRRCASDGVLRYHSPLGPQGAQTSPDKNSAAGKQDAPRTLLNDGQLLLCSSGSVSSLTGSSDSNTEAPTDPGLDGGRDPTDGRVQGGPWLHKGHGVTVNKMQQWMTKGRQLSSEMKQRIQGSSLPTGGHYQQQMGPRGPPGGTRPGPAASSRGPKTAKDKWPPTRGPQQPVSFDGVQSSSHNRGVEASPWRPQLATITVSKKLSWLQQSAKDLPPEEAQPPTPSPEPLNDSGGAEPRQTRLQLPQLRVATRRSDPAEENDADDEGEIWYNPIPEDDEPNAHRGAASPADAIGVDPKWPGPGEEVGCRALDEPEGEEDTAPSSEVPRLNTLKPPEEGGPSREAGGMAPPLSIGFSPPSSPNPTKKSGALGWSLPDRIKSPRSVRKISMRMKKLPELSRKLSVKAAAAAATGTSQAEPCTNAPQTSGPSRLAPSGSGQARRNVISRYHLDSSVSTQLSFRKKGGSGSGSKAASKGGYLSDGDSPELLAKSGKHGCNEGKGGRVREMEGGVVRLNGAELDIDAFRHYSFTEQPKCSQFISGLMSLHLYGAEDLKPPRVDSRDVYCAIQVDAVNKARTALLSCRTAFLDLDHTFNIELENAQHLKLLVFGWEPALPPRRHRACCHGTVALPPLFRATRCHQLAVKLEPRGLIYVKLGLLEQRQNAAGGATEPQVFGVEAWRVVERENTGQMVPLLISKCIEEIQKRGCQVVGLYRLCGSAAVKKELREAFERNSATVELNENIYPDINVITGVLKDYLRELPRPLITQQLYEAVLVSMATRPLRMGAAGCENDLADSEVTVGLLENLPEVERMTLQKLLDHLKLVASHQDVNKMTCQNLAVCFGPVLLSQRQEASCHSNRVFLDSEELASALHFKKHIQVLHYLLQLWPVVDPLGGSTPLSHAASLAPPLRRRKERPQVLNLSEAEMAGVLRPRPGRLDSPSNRYAGDWSGCGDGYFPSDSPPARCRSGDEADYDDVASEELEEVPVGAEPPGGEESPTSDQEQDPTRREEEEGEEDEGESDESPSEEEAEPQEEEEEDEEEEAAELACNHFLLSRERSFQAYMKLQELRPVLGSHRVNLRDLQESIDTLIGNLERELNKNKLHVGY